jgi:TonB family protein
MKAVERDRFLVGFLFAAAIHVLLVLLLGTVDLGVDTSLRKTLPPVRVHLQTVEVQKAPDIPVPKEITEPRDLPEPPVMEQTSPPSPLPSETDRSRDIVSGGSGAAGAAGAASGASGAAGAAGAEYPYGSDAGVGSDFRVPQPSAEARRRAEMEVEQGPRAFSGRTSGSAAGAQSLEGPLTGSVGSPGTGEISGESEVVYADEGRRGPSARDAESAAGTPSAESRELSDSGPVVSDELLRKMEDLGSTAAQGTGDSGGWSPGNASESDGGSAAGTGSGGATQDSPQELRSASGDVVVSLEKGHPTRRLISSGLPDLSDEQLSQLPGTMEAVVAFTLQPDGFPLVHLPLEASTGYPEIDKSIVEAVRKWKFTPLAGGETDTAEGQARIVIRAK